MLLGGYERYLLHWAPNLTNLEELGGGPIERPSCASDVFVHGSGWTSCIPVKQGYWDLLNFVDSERAN